MISSGGTTFTTFAWYMIVFTKESLAIFYFVFYNHISFQSLSHIQDLHFTAENQEWTIHHISIAVFNIILFFNVSV